MHAAERGERWASLTRWTDGAGADNWRLAANRGGVIILAVTLGMLGTAYLQCYMPVLIDRTPPLVWWTPFMFGSIYVFLGWMDWMSAKAIESGQTARLKPLLFFPQPSMLWCQRRYYGGRSPTSCEPRHQRWVRYGTLPTIWLKP